MLDWTLYERSLGVGRGVTDRQELAQETLEAFGESIEDDPSYCPDATVNGVTTPLLAEQTDSGRCKLKAVVDADICAGDTVVCRGKTYVVYKSYIDAIGILTGELWEANWNLKFQTGTAAIISRPIVVNGGSVKLQRGNAFIVFPDDNFEMYIGGDAAVDRIHIGKRIAISHSYSSEGRLELDVYVVAGIDRLSYSPEDGDHLYCVKLTRDAYNPDRDDLESTVCDIIVEHDVPFPVMTGRCEITGKEKIRLGKRATFTTTFYDASGSPVTGVDATWSVIAPDGVTYATEGNTASVEVGMSSALIGGTIRLTSSATGYGSYSKEVTVVGY